MALLSRYYPNTNQEDPEGHEARVARYALFVSLVPVVVMWLIWLVGTEFGIDFSSYGVFPLTISGLCGVFFSPMIHGSFSHLIANTFPLFILTFSLFYFYRKQPFTIFLLNWVLSGFLVWLGGREDLHIGASGVIYGLAAFLFLGGILSRSLGLLTISLLVSLLYGSLLWGIFPVKPEISWESHLWGGATGFLLAWVFRKTFPHPVLAAEEVEEENTDIQWQQEEGAVNDAGEAEN